MIGETKTESGSSSPTAKIGETIGGAGHAARPRRSVSVRTLSRFYLTATGLLTIAAFVAVSANWLFVAVALLVCGAIAIPIFSSADRLKYDGVRIKRVGIVAWLQRLTRARRTTLELDQIELIETEAVRTLRQQGAVRYRYHTAITGREARFAFASGGAAYREFIRAVLTDLAPDKLDARSAELRDYLSDEKSLRATRQLLHIAPLNVLEDADGTLPRRPHHPNRRHPLRRRTLARRRPESVYDENRGQLLRAAANELRVAGRLRESGEAFRRALLAMPADGWLIYDFARYLFSEASANGDADLLSRSNAALRLAARRADRDAVLLSRIGESLAERGELRTATRVFERALEVEPDSFRASLGLAEIALRSARLAHVVHHYGAAARSAPDTALANFAQREADYYTRLNSDDDYLEAEVNRISRLHNLQKLGRPAARLALIAAAFSLAIMFFDVQFAAAGWSLAAVASLAWLVLTIYAQFHADRKEG